MSASLQIHNGSEPFGEVTEALYFESGMNGLFGWLHRSFSVNRANIGLVICKPFGYEAICSHRSLRTFAESAAALNIPVLRFDYLGTGDSADIDPDADQIAEWILNVIVAVGELQRRTGVERVYLLGFRIGALLATLAARQCSSVAGLLLIAPILNGRRYVKELRTTRLAGLLGAGAAALRGDPKSTVGDGPGSIEVSGFTFSAATLTALMDIDLQKSQMHPKWGILVIDSEILPTAREWAAKLLDSGAEVAYLRLPGIVEMLMTAPQFAVVPRDMIATVKAWLAQKIVDLSAQTDLTTARRVINRDPLPENVLKLPVAKEIESRFLTERALRFGSEVLLFGVVTEPSGGEQRRRAVILLNAGVDQHIGASRLYVSLARLWGSRGYVVLRMDLAGIGDSDTRQGARDDDVFPASALDDVRTAIDYLKEHYSIGDVTLAGLCSGAYHALRAAASGISVTRILMINPQNYFWKQGMSLTDLQAVEALRNPGVYRQQVMSGAAWRRLLSGEVDLWRIARVYALRAQLASVTLLRDLARFLSIRLSNDLGRDLEDIASRGIGIVFVFAHGEPGLDLLKLEGGRCLKRLGNRCRIIILPIGDHVFSHRASRSELKRVLSAELFASGMIRKEA